jgi:hypothetical protein
LNQRQDDALREQRKETASSKEELIRGKLDKDKAERRVKELEDRLHQKAEEEKRRENI